jgi:KDO2-lipid IV(A) lauroyltransferase
VRVPLERRALLDAGLTRTLAANRKSATTRAVYGKTGLADGAAAVNRLVAANLRFTAAYYARSAALLSAAGRRLLRRTVRPVGEEHLRRATQAGHGVLLLAVHLGDFDVAGHWLASELGCDLVVVSAAVRPAWRGAFYTRARTTAGFRVRREDRTTLLDLVGDLRNGHVVLFLADRRSPGRSLAVRFLGCPSTVSAAPAWLSASTGAPLVTAATFTDREQNRLLVFGEPRWARSPADQSWAQPALAELETSVRGAPHQWHIPADVSQIAVELSPRKLSLPAVRMQSAIPDDQSGQPT